MYVIAEKQKNALPRDNIQLRYMYGCCNITRHICA